MNNIAARILSQIKKVNMSYGELATQTGIPKSALQRYATGETEKIPLDRIEKIANALNTTASNLMGWDDEEQETIKQFEPTVEEAKKILIEKANLNETDMNFILNFKDGENLLIKLAKPML